MPGHREDRCLTCEIAVHKTVRLTADVVPGDHGYAGSLLWHGVPTTPRTMNLFAEFVATELSADGVSVDSVVAVVSSGLIWGTAVSLQLDRTIVPLRLMPHRYGPYNPMLPTLEGKRVALVDNFVGSGQTLQEASAILRGYDISLSSYCVESASSSVDARPLISTATKLKQLQSLCYFDEVADEVVNRFLQQPQTWLKDTRWVEAVLRHIATSDGVRKDFDVLECHHA